MKFLASRLHLCLLLKVRGSIPILWSEVPNLRYKPKREFGPPADSAKALLAHMSALSLEYQVTWADVRAGDA